MQIIQMKIMIIFIFMLLFTFNAEANNNDTDSLSALVYKMDIDIGNLLYEEMEVEDPNSLWLGSGGMPMTPDGSSSSREFTSNPGGGGGSGGRRYSKKDNNISTPIFIIPELRTLILLICGFLLFHKLRV